MPETLAQQLEAATKKVTDLEAKVAGLTTDAEASATKIEALEADKGKLTADLSTSGEKVSALEEDLKTSKASLVTATADLEKVKGQLALTPGMADLSAGTSPVADDSAGAGGASTGLWDNYNMLKKSNPEAATTFYRENEKALKAETAAKMAAESDK